MLLPGSPSRRSGNLGGTLTGATSEDSPTSSPCRACRDEKGEATESSEPPKTLPPHHLAGRAEMRRESQPRQSGSMIPLQKSNSWTPSSRMNRGDRSELTCTDRATRGSSTPLAGQMSSGKRGRPSRSNTKASRGPPPPHPALLKGGREKKGKPRGA